MTDQPKWTPGPWGLLVEQSYRPVCTVATIEQTGEDFPYRGMIARLQSAEHIEGIDGAELTANAHLIAAAPDMAEVLDEVSGFAHQTARDRDLSDAELAFMRRVDAALAKARGQA